MANLGGAALILDQIIDRSRAACPHIVLPEGEDRRIVEAAVRAVQDGVANVTLLASPSGFAAASEGVQGAEALTVVDPATSDKQAAYSAAYLQLRRHKGVDEQQARQAMIDPLGFAAMMVRLGDADGTLGGAVATTADTVRVALQVIGKAPGIDVVSSCFLMLLGAPHERAVIFGDCGLILQPGSAELANIAISSAQSLESLTGEEPRVAMLSFSTMGSVTKDAHESLARIENAVTLIRDRAPNLKIDGEMQFDAALIPEVALSKAPDSEVAGQANVFVFPSLSAGNIGYKIAQRIGGAIALGPILQGLAHPANDLSRGCSADDVYQMIAITGAQAASTVSDQSNKGCA